MVREILDAGLIGVTRTRSEIEIALLEFLDGVRLPRPRMNVWIEVGEIWIEVDCLWPEQKVIAELDSHRFHGTPAAFASDRARARALAANGWRPIRITWRHIQERAPLKRDLRRLLLGCASTAPDPARPDAARHRP